MIKYGDCLPLILIACGGFLGAAARFLIDGQIPWLAGTLIVNIAGCFLLGIFMYESIYIGRFGRNTRLFFGVGFMGAFTTFSAFALQSFETLPALGIANILVNIILGLAAVLAGRHVISYQRGI
ncbi:MAG: fluoride efflux transporter CrcB [Methanoregula sp.]|jgi:CrcB protein